MNLKLIRYSANKESTLGAFFIDDVFICHTLEDEYRPISKKVMSETRIPEGTYKIILATWGGHHKRYGTRFPAFHKGMLLLENVPGFQGILIHMGNIDDHTAGCILTGMTATNNKMGDGQVLNSEQAYRLVYPPIANAIEARQPVTITVSNVEKLINPS